VRIEDDLPGATAQDVGMSVPEWKDLQRSGIFQYVSPVGGGSVKPHGLISAGADRLLQRRAELSCAAGGEAGVGPLV
jgi:hypothetical protein